MTEHADWSICHACERSLALTSYQPYNDRGWLYCCAECYASRGDRHGSICEMVLHETADEEEIIHV